MKLEYLGHLPDEYRKPAIHLYETALKTKLEPLLGSNGRSYRIISKNIAQDQCITAFYKRRLVGVLGIQTREKSFWNPKVTTLMGEYGRFSGLMRFCGLYFLHHTTLPGEWCIDGIAVSESMRSRGVGSGMIRCLETMAAEKGIRKLTLEVINTNPRARLLYERLGFSVTYSESLWPLNYLFGFDFESSVQMEKAVGECALIQ